MNLLSIKRTLYSHFMEERWIDIHVRTLHPPSRILENKTEFAATLRLRHLHLEGIGIHTV